MMDKYVFDVNRLLLKKDNNRFRLLRESELRSIARFGVVREGEDYLEVCVEGDGLSIPFDDVILVEGDEVRMMYTFIRVYGNEDAMRLWKLYFNKDIKNWDVTLPRFKFYPKGFLYTLGSCLFDRIKIYIVDKENYYLTKMGRWYVLPEKSALDIVRVAKKVHLVEWDLPPGFISVLIMDSGDNEGMWETVWTTRSIVQVPKKEPISLSPFSIEIIEICQKL